MSTRDHSAMDQATASSVPVPDRPQSTNQKSLFCNAHYQHTTAEKSLPSIGKKQADFGGAFDIYDAYENWNLFDMTRDDELWLLRKTVVRSRNIDDPSLGMLPARISAPETIFNQMRSAGHGHGRFESQHPYHRISSKTNVRVKGMAPRSQAQHERLQSKRHPHPSSNPHKQEYGGNVHTPSSATMSASELLPPQLVPTSLTKRLWLDEISGDDLKSDLLVFPQILGHECWLVIGTIDANWNNRGLAQISKSLNATLENHSAHARITNARHCNTFRIALLVSKFHRVHILPPGSLEGLPSALPSPAVFACTLVKSTIKSLSGERQGTPLVRLVLNDHCCWAGSGKDELGWSDYVERPESWFSRRDACESFVSSTYWNNGPLLSAQKTDTLASCVDKSVERWMKTVLEHGVCASKQDGMESIVELVACSSLLLRHARLNRKSVGRNDTRVFSIEDGRKLKMIVKQTDGGIYVFKHKTFDVYSGLRLLVDDEGSTFLSTTSFWRISNHSRSSLGHLCIPFGRYDDRIAFNLMSAVQDEKLVPEMSKVRSFFLQAMEHVKSTMFDVGQQGFCETAIIPPACDTKPPNLSETFNVDDHTLQQLGNLNNLLEIPVIADVSEREETGIGQNKSNEMSSLFYFTPQYIKSSRCTYVVNISEFGNLYKPSGSLVENIDIFMIRPRSCLNYAPIHEVEQSVSDVVADSMSEDVHSGGGNYIDLCDIIEHAREQSFESTQSSRFMTYLM